MHTTGHQTRIAPRPVSAGDVVVAVIQRLLDWQERASQRHHLAGLDERALHDIGISRADADGEAMKPFWRA